MIKIGDFSKLSRLSIRVLRHYDEIGLLKPVMIDEQNGYRFYEEWQLERANRIVALKQIYLNLDTIKTILDHDEDTSLLLEYLNVQDCVITEKLEKAREQQQLIDTMIKQLNRDHPLVYQIIRKEYPSQTVVSLRNTIPTYEDESMLWSQMMVELGDQTLDYANPCNARAIFHDEEYRDQDVDVEVQMSVNKMGQNTDWIRFKTTQAQVVASTILKGSYEQVGAVNEAILQWVQNNHYTFDGPMFNIYLVGPNETEDPNEWVTEVCFPIKKLSIRTTP